MNVRDGALDSKRPAKLKDWITLLAIILGLAALGYVALSAVRGPDVSEKALDSSNSLFISVAPANWHRKFDRKERCQRILDAAFQKISNETRDRNKSVIKIDTIFVSPEGELPEWVELKVSWESHD